MNTEIRDYNNAGSLVTGTCRQEWADLAQTFASLHLYLKPSDQARIQGTPIFDPIATNAAIKVNLQGRNWSSDMPIPKRYRFLGTNIDLGKNGVIVEIQFSNYPFLLNNTFRSELFYKAGLVVTSRKTALVVIITKGHMFPASNSTLYYEQAKNQLDALADNNVFDVPIRLVGLTTLIRKRVPAVYTKYTAARYSRTIARQTKIQADIAKGRSSKSRCTITIREDPR